MEDLELPAIDLGGTEFRVDLSNEWIFEVANPANFISFNELEETGRDFRFVYDPVSKNLFKGEEEEMIERVDLKYIILDQLKWMPAFGFVWSLPEQKQDFRMRR